MHNKTAIKRNRTSKIANLRNKTKKSAFATFEKKYRAAIAAKEMEKAAELLNLCLSRLDKNAKDGVFHPNKAARKKSQLQKMLSTASTAQA